jgi:hypothetical protein
MSNVRQRLVDAQHRIELLARLQDALGDADLLSRRARKTAREGKDVNPGSLFSPDGKTFYQVWRAATDKGIVISFTNAANGEVKDVPWGERGAEVTKALSRGSWWPQAKALSKMMLQKKRI